MQEVTAKKITMQTNFLNRLLEDRSTPTGKIKIELIMLNHLLENYGTESRNKATPQEAEEMQEALKKAQELINKINTILED